MTNFDVNSIFKLILYISTFQLACYISYRGTPNGEIHEINNLFLSNNYLAILFFSTSTISQLFNNINLSQLGLSLVCINYSFININ